MILDTNTSPKAIDVVYPSEIYRKDKWLDYVAFPKGEEYLKKVIASIVEKLESYTPNEVEEQRTELFALKQEKKRIRSHKLKQAKEDRLQYLQSVLNEYARLNNKLGYYMQLLNNDEYGRTIK